MNLIYTANTLKNKYTTANPNKIKGWDFIEYTRQDKGMSPLIESRFYKILHPYEHGYKTTLYYDTKFNPKFDYSEWARQYREYDLVVMKHNRRDCAYKEIEYCIDLGAFDNYILEKQLEYLKRIQFPSDYGLWAPGIMLRRQSESIDRFNKLWWEYFEYFPCRDQISLAMAIYKSNIKIKALDFKKTYNLFMGR